MDLSDSEWAFLGAVFTGGSGAAGRAGASVDGPAQGAQRHPVDTAHGRAVEGLAAEVWLACDGAPALPEVAGRGHHRAAAQGRGRVCAKARRARLEGVFCGRHVCSGQKGGAGVGPTKRGKGTKIMAMADAHGLPLALRTASARTAEVTLTEPTVEAALVRMPFMSKLIADRAYDSDPLRERLEGRFIERVCPHRRGRLRPKTQDGRALRRYKRRWKVERLFAWMGNDRRTLIRWEYCLENFHAFVQLAFTLIFLGYL